MRTAYERLVEDDRRRRETFLDPYGAENPAEFFAILTETFFEIPHDLALEHPELYELLQGAYGLDPRTWHPVPANLGGPGGEASSP
jgi:Mlc titration factor MtfA (ptsG expression regulator)